MTRLPLTDAQTADAQTEKVYESFKQEGRSPIALYLAVAHSPATLTGFDAAGQAVRHAPETARALRELLILRVSQLTDSNYEWAHHVGMALAAGVTREQIDELARWTSSTLFSEPERAALQAADEIHNVDLTQSTFDRLSAHYSVAQTIEIIFCAAHYQSVARVIQALDIDIESEYSKYL